MRPTTTSVPSPRAIVGLQLRITRVEAKAKLSLNRGVADVDGTIEGLEGGTPHDSDVVKAMRRLR